MIIDLHRTPMRRHLGMIIALVLGVLSTGCTTRDLSSNEVMYARGIFRDTVPYEHVNLVKGGEVGLLSLTEHDAVTLGYRIVFDPKIWADDYYPSPPNVSTDLHLLCHELCHVWQYENAALTNFTFSKVIGEHLKYGKDVYDYPKPLDPNRKFLSYRYEQQGKIVQDYLLLLITDPQAAAVYAKVIDDAVRYVEQNRSASRASEAWSAHQ